MHLTADEPVCSVMVDGPPESPRVEGWTNSDHIETLDDVEGGTSVTNGGPMSRRMLLTTVAVVALAAPAARADHVGRVAWTRNAAHGFERARAERKPILLYFSASW